MENLIKTEIKLICLSTEDEEIDGIDKIVALKNWRNVDLDINVELTEDDYNKLVTLVEDLGATYNCLKVGYVRPFVITAYDFEEAERINDAIQGFLKNRKPVEEKVEENYKEGKMTMENKIRVLVNICYKKCLDNDTGISQFDKNVSVDDYYKIAAFLKDCPFVESPIKGEDLQNFKMITVECSKKMEALAILHGLNGCIKTHVNFIQELPNKEDSTPKNNSISSEIDYITKNLDDSDLFLQLAEEAAELSQACLKYVRAYRGNNPTKDSADVYLKNILEELTDVRVSADALNIEEDIDTYINKIHRWANRIRSKNAGEKK